MNVSLLASYHGPTAVTSSTTVFKTAISVSTTVFTVQTVTAQVGTASLA